MRSLNAYFCAICQYGWTSAGSVYEYDRSGMLRWFGILSKPSILLLSYAVSNDVCWWSGSLFWNNGRLTSSIVLPCESRPLCAVSIPGNPLNKLSTVRFSWMMMMTCLMMPCCGPFNGPRLCDGTTPGAALEEQPAITTAAATTQERRKVILTLVQRDQSCRFPTPLCCLLTNGTRVRRLPSR